MDIYREVLLEAANNPQNYGKLDDADVVSHHLNPSCGDEITVYIKTDRVGKIIDISWEGQGCIISRASMGELSELLKNMPHSEFEKIDKTTLLDLLGIETIAPGREKCLLVGLQTVKKALKTR
jgi:nitrogen fixation protein NifU and related proteins